MVFRSNGWTRPRTNICSRHQPRPETPTLQHPGPGYRNHIEHHRFGHGDTMHVSSIKLGELNPAPAGPNSGETNQMISKRALELAGLLGIAMALATFAPARAAGDDDDPPSRAARLAYAHGSVSFQPAGTDDWVASTVNRPMTTGDKLWSDDGSRAEVQLDGSLIRLSNNTGIAFLNLSDTVTQIQLSEGTLLVRVRRLDDDEAYEI